MTNYSICFRIFEMLQLLERQPGCAMSVADLASELGVSERTVKRYASALQDPDGQKPALVSRDVRDGRSWVELTEARLSVVEQLRDYAVLADILGEYQGAVSAWKTRLQDAFVVVPFCPERYDDEDLLHTFIKAAVERRVVEAAYADRNKQTLQPWSVVRYLDAHYVVGRPHSNDGHHADRPLTWSIKRFEHVKILNDTFEVPDSFDPGDHFQGGVGALNGTNSERVRVAFNRQAYQIAGERDWPGQVQWDQSGSRHILTLDVTVTFELEAWILSWGPDAEVLEPKHLRQRVLDRLRSAVGSYQIGQAPKRSTG